MNYKNTQISTSLIHLAPNIIWLYGLGNLPFVGLYRFGERQTCVTFASLLHFIILLHWKTSLHINAQVLGWLSLQWRRNLPALEKNIEYWPVQMNGQQVCNWSNPEKTGRSCEGTDFSWLSSKVSRTLAWKSKNSRDPRKSRYEIKLKNWVEEYHNKWVSVAWKHPKTALLGATSQLLPRNDLLEIIGPASKGEIATWLFPIFGTCLVSLVLIVKPKRGKPTLPN